MRIIGRSLILLLLLILVWYAYSTWQALFQEDHNNLATPYPNVNAERNDVYLLSLSNIKKGAALSFLLDSGIERLQIASIPLFTTSKDTPDAFSPENIIQMREQGDLPKYAIEYSLLDDKNTILTQETYWFNAIPTSWTTAEGDALVPSLFLSDADYYAGTRQSIFLRMNPWPTARRLELRMHNQPKEISGSSVYVRQHFKRTKEDANLLWRKLSDKKRTRQTENVHMYPHYIWSNNEISSLLSRFWLQLGPEGVVGKDFTTLGLYRVKALPKDLTAESSDNPEPVSRLYINQNKHLTFPIHFEGEVQLSFRPSISEASSSDASTSSKAATSQSKSNHATGKLLTIIQHPFDGSAAIISHQLITQSTAIWKGMVKKGLLELKSEPQLDIEILAMPDALSAEHKHHQTRYFLVDANKPLTYVIDHWREQATPIKIELRAMLNHPELMTKSDTTVNAHWLNTDKQTQADKDLLSQQIKLDFTPSRYEHLASAIPDISNKSVVDKSAFNSSSLNTVSEGKSAYFLAPRSVNQLQITSTNPVLVKVSSRPLELPLRRKVPSHNRGWFDDEDYLPTWFVLQPNNHDLLINRGDSLKLKTLHRPLIDRYADVTEELIGERFVPLPSKKSSNLNQILIPIDNTETLLNTSPLRRYRQLNIQSHNMQSRAIKLDFENDTRSHSLSPAVIFISDSMSPREVSFTLDKQAIHSQWISGYVGKVSLPKIIKGARSLAIQLDKTADNKHSSDNHTWFINQVDYVDYVDDANYLVLKEGYALDKNAPLSYEIDKKDSETLLNVTFYQEQLPLPMTIEKGEPLIEVKLIKSASEKVKSATKLSDSQTIPIRQWRLQAHANTSEQGYLLNRGNKKTDTGTHFVYSLADDLAPGKYKIQISLKEGNNGYVHVSRLVPKPGFDIDFFRESIHAY